MAAGLESYAWPADESWQFRRGRSSFAHAPAGFGERQAVVLAWQPTGFEGSGADVAPVSSSSMAMASNETPNDTENENASMAYRKRQHLPRRDARGARSGPILRIVSNFNNWQMATPPESEIGLDFSSRFER